MMQLHPSHTKDKTLTNIGNCVIWVYLPIQWSATKMGRTRWKSCWSTPWQSGRDTDQMEIKITRWKSFSNTLWPPETPFRAQFG